MTNDRYEDFKYRMSKIFHLAHQAPAGEEILEASLEILNMLLNKNVAYGNSALNPIRIFSNADDFEQLNVRIDDKLNRIKNKKLYAGDNDEDDLIGYLLLKKAKKNGIIDKKENDADLSVQVSEM
jgi:hypothetical protein